MNFQLDLNTITNLLVVGAVGFTAKFLRKVDVRLTRIETFCKLCHPHIKHENENENED